MKMKGLSFSLLILTCAVAGGCARTVGPVEFLYLQLAQAPPGQSEMGWYASYDGKRHGYHYMKLRWSNWGDLCRMILMGAYTKEMVRCRADMLGDKYPEDMYAELKATKLRGYSWGLKERAAIDAFIRSYLSKRGKLRPEDKALLDRPHAGQKKP